MMFSTPKARYMYQTETTRITSDLLHPYHSRPNQRPVFVACTAASAAASGEGVEGVFLFSRIRTSISRSSSWTRACASSRYFSWAKHVCKSCRPCRIPHGVKIPKMGGGVDIPCKPRTLVGQLVSWPVQGRNKIGHDGWVHGCRCHCGARNGGSTAGMTS